MRLLPLVTATLLASEAAAQINWDPTLEEARAFVASIGKKPRCDGENFTGKGVVVSTPLCRLEQSAISARERYEDFVVTEELVAEHRPGFLSVLAYPWAHGAKIVEAPDILVLKSEDEKTFVKPSSADALGATEFSNKMGYRDDFPATITWFSAEDVMKVMSPKGEWRVVARRTDRGEYTLKFKAKSFR